MINFWSHSPISVVRFLFSSALASSAVGKGSPRWCSQYSKTYAINAISRHVLRHGRREDDKLFSAPTKRRSAMGWAGRSPRRLGVSGMVRYEKEGPAETVDLPSSMFLMRTLRSATSLSTTNCSLSEVTRRTIVAWVVGEEMEMEKKRERRRNSRAEIAFSRAWSLYVSILPFRTASTRQSPKMTWLGLWRGLQSPAASSPFSLTGRIIALFPRCHGSRQRTQAWDQLGPPRNAPAARSETTEGHLESGWESRNSPVRPPLSRGDCGLLKDAL